MMTLKQFKFFKKRSQYVWTETHKDRKHTQKKKTKNKKHRQKVYFETVRKL